jgi:hypothetical protein
MREPRLVELYLDANAGREPCRGVGAGSYLEEILGEHDSDCWDSHLRSLLCALERRAAEGEVIRLPSAESKALHFPARGRHAAYHKAADLTWPITLPLMSWAEAQGDAAVPVEIDCAHHLRRCKIGILSGWEVLIVCEADETIQKILNARAITLERPQGPGDPAAPALRSLLAEAAQMLATQPDTPIRAAVHPDSVRHPVGLAAAALHARDCLHADAIIRAVETEIAATGRVAYALRSAADPAWVALRALETA